MPIPREIAGVIRPFMESAPVKIGAIAETLGIKVYVSSLPAGISGRLYRSEGGGVSGWSIMVNRSDIRHRQRFTVAHEIGHFVLHKDRIDNEVVDDVFYRSSLSNALEAEANRFAADLLMPWELINKLTDAGKNSAAELAQALGVSEVAMKIRLGLPT